MKKGRRTNHTQSANSNRTNTNLTAQLMSKQELAGSVVAVSDGQDGAGDGETYGWGEELTDATAASATLDDDDEDGTSALCSCPW